MPASCPSLARGVADNYAPSAGPSGPPACLCIVLEGFLLPDEQKSLIRHTLDHVGDFETAGLYTRSSAARVVRRNSRRARVLSKTGKIGLVIRQRVRSYLPWILGRMGIRPFRVANIVAQITASNHGDFFRKHMDDFYGVRRRRVLSYAYYFHCTPRRFAGGELLLYPTWRQDGKVVFATAPRTITPRQNRIVFFPTNTLHEVRTVLCPSQKVADSRFTVNGWVSC